VHFDPKVGYHHLLSTNLTCEDHFQICNPNYDYDVKPSFDPLIEPNLELKNEQVGPSTKIVMRSSSMDPPKQSPIINNMDRSNTKNDC
jgi:hypothetical protein